MALVAYEYSDDSDTETASDSLSTLVSGNKCESSSSIEEPHATILDDEIEVISRIRRPPGSLENDNSDDDEEQTIPISFSNLPKPNFHAFNIDDLKGKNTKLSSLNKLLRPGSSNKSAGESNKKKLNFSEKDSGLLAVLPSPKIEAPPSVFITPKTINTPKTLIPLSVKNKKTVSKLDKVEKENGELQDGDDEIGMDFFSLTKVEEISEPVDVELPEQEIDSLKLAKKEVSNSPSNVDYDTDSMIQRMTGEDEDNFAISRSHIQLDKDAMHVLCGRKRKNTSAEEIEVIDIHEEHVLAKSKEISSKHLTDESMHRRTFKSGGPSTLSKRKHQITYLAYQAKEREMELKDMWAANRLTKKQTQSKYGF